ncbi:MAG: HTH domain-containing protein [Micropruina sp.]|nr:HTH domain-containing protein [Micropruina sp.]
MPAQRLGAASRDPHLTLRRVERQQRIIEILAARPEPVTVMRLAEELRVAHRTVERDVARLRESGVPIESRPGRRGGLRLHAPVAVHRLALETAEVAALLASLAALGPTATESAASATRKLTACLRPGVPSATSPSRSSGR